MKNALLQRQKINHVVTKKPKNVERMKEIVIVMLIVKLVLLVELIIVLLGVTSPLKLIVVIV